MTSETERSYRRRQDRDKWRPSGFNLSKDSFTKEERTDGELGQSRVQPRTERQNGSIKKKK